ncbi:MAG: hypothetical protein ABL999_01260 [Pyrinomonadaceae bacterium]
MKKLIFVGLFLGFMFAAAETASAQLCKPNADQIAVFENDNFQGRCKVLNVGDFPSPQRIGFDNDSITSLKVGANVQVDVCEDDNYQGVCQTYGEDAGTLVGTNIGNDSISSLKVYRKNAPAVTKPPPPANTNSGNAKKLDLIGALEFVGVIDKLRGNWLDTSAAGEGRKYVFTNAGELFVVNPEVDYAYSRYTYLVTDAQTIQLHTNKFEVVTAKMKFQGDRLTLAWTGSSRPATELKIESDMPSSNPGSGCGSRCLPIGNWVGIAGTNTAGERISVFYDGKEGYWLSSQNKGEWKTKTFWLNVDMEWRLEAGEGLQKVSFSGDTVTLDENGVKKTYQRILKFPK